MGKPAAEHTEIRQGNGRAQQFFRRHGSCRRVVAQTIQSSAQIGSVADREL
jgi:hypothetical protein